MNDENMKEVRFDLYCESCEHLYLSEDEEPCNECLGEPARQYTRKPLRFEDRINLKSKK